jgi:predicted dehydrogenase
MKNIWLIGAGPMAQEYFRVLNSLNVNVSVIGRGINSAEKFKNETNFDLFQGGIKKFLSKYPVSADFAIVAVNVKNLAKVTKQLIDYGIKSILVEKPGGLDKSEIESLCDHSDLNGSNVYIAYNRRFYQSVLLAEKMIAEDGGVLSFSFDFTELIHRLEEFEIPLIEKKMLLLNNSSHVIDLAFFLGGMPKKIKCYHNENSIIDWHSAASIFTGSGITDNGALFCYGANWEAPGRWALTINTLKRKLIFCPLEQLKVQEHKSFDINNYSFDNDYDIDKKYKPGLYKLVEAFINDDDSSLCEIKEMKKLTYIYYKIANY